MANRGGISYEPCTLVYTLLDDSRISFDDFCLIIRSLHSFMVENVTPNPSMKNVHVKLNYQASLINAQNKLGALQDVVGVTKLSAYVKEDEFSRLELLKRQFGIGTTEAEEPQPQSYAAPRGRGRGGFQQRKFTPRPSPYQKKQQPKSLASFIQRPGPSTEYFSQSPFPDAQAFEGESSEPAAEYPGEGQQ